MGLFDRVKQTVSQIGNRVKQTANTVSNGMKWAHQNIIQPGIAAGKTIGGDIGKFAENVETGANAVNDLNDKYRSGSASVGDVIGAGKAVKESYQRGRESAGGAVKQVRNEFDNVRKIARSGDMKSARDYVGKAASLSKRVSGAMNRRVATRA